MCACSPGLSMRRGAPSSPPAPSRGRMRDGALRLGARLCQALQGEEDAMVEALLRQGADPNLVLSGGVAAIHLAAGMEPASGVLCLAHILQHGGDPNLRSVDGLTPLHVAASWGHDTRVRLLLMEGGNPQLEDQEGNTALDLARKHGNERCALLLRGSEEDEQSSWMGQRRAESFLSTVTEDTWDAEGSLGFCSPCPANPGRTPESRADSPGGARSCFFPSVVAAAERGGTSENSLEEEEEEEEDWQPPSFLTECSWQDATSSNQRGIPPRLVSSRDPLGPSVGEEAADYGTVEGVRDPQLSPHRPGAPVKVRCPPSLENLSTREGDLSPDPKGLPLQATLTSPEAPLPGVNPETLSIAGSPEVPKPPLSCPEGPECTADSDRWVAGATLNLTQYSDFLDPELVVKLGHHEGLDVTSPDHVYLFSRANPVTLSDLERTVVIGGEPGGCWDTGKPFCRGSGGGGGTSLYTSCHSECYVSTTDTSGCNWAQKSGGQQASLAHSPGSSGTSRDSHPWLVPVAQGLSCEGLAAGNPDRSAGTGPLQRGRCLEEAFPRTTPGKQPGDSQIREGVREASPSRPPHVPLTVSPWQKEGSRLLARGPLQEPQGLSTLQAEKEVLPESHLFPKGKEVAAQEPQREGGRMMMPDGRADLEEEEEEEEVGETEPAGVSESTQIALGAREAPWAQDTLLVQRPLEDVTAFPSCGSTLSVGTSEEAGFTLPVPDPPAHDAGEEPGSLEVKLRLMMLATKIRHSPLVQSQGGPCHVTLGVPTPDDNSCPSLFEETLEMPRRPQRVRRPEAKPPSSCKEPHGTLCPETSGPPGTETGGPNGAPFIPAGPGSPRPGLGSSNLPPAAPAVPMDSSCWPGGRAGMGPSGDAEPMSLAQEREPSLPRSSQGPCTSPEMTPAERPAVRGGKAKGPPRPSRVSFSRLSARGPPCLPVTSVRLPGRLSPTGQVVPLSPGGRPINVSAAEPVEFLYVDEDQGHTLVERHVPCTDDSLANTTAGSEDTVLYDWRAYAHQVAHKGASPTPAASGAGPLSDEALVHQLRDLGVHPGPVTGLTRKLYLQLLEKLRSDPKTKARKGPSGYSPELSSALETYQIPDGKGDEMALAGQFDQPDKSKKWREGLLKSSFNYLLLDPRVTQNLPFRSQFVSQGECFRTFVSAIFYVGKGKRSRPYSHLYEALNHYKGRSREKKVPSKVQHILEIWASGQGVVSMHCFQNVIPVEAYTREACMVDAIGLKMLTNQKKGNYYGVVAAWPMKRRRGLGVHLLHRAMQIFLAEGERQLRPADIQAGP